MVSFHYEMLTESGGGGERAGGINSRSGSESRSAPTRNWVPTLTLPPSFSADTGAIKFISSGSDFKYGISEDDPFGLYVMRLALR